jgi:hypothetical protein
MAGAVGNALLDRIPPLDLPAAHGGPHLDRLSWQQEVTPRELVGSLRQLLQAPGGHGAQAHQDPRCSAGEQDQTRCILQVSSQ